MTKRAYDRIGEIAVQTFPSEMFAHDMRRQITAEGCTAPTTGFIYPDGRPIYTAISAAWRYHNKKGDKATADKIAHVYVDENGEHVYDKY